MRIIFTLLLFALSHDCLSQHIGDRTDIILYLIEQNFDNRKTKDILKHGELQYTFDVKYDSQNKIQEIIVNHKNAIYYDLEAKSDISVRYLFDEKEELTSTATTFIDLTKKYVEEKFNKLYGHRNHGFGYYFTHDYQNVRYIYEEDGSAVVVFKKFVPTAYESLKFHKLIKSKQEEYKNRKE